MSNLATYTFIPWFRQGLSSKIKEQDTLGSGNGSATERAGLRVDLVVENTSASTGAKSDNIITKQVSLLGPGDVMGINRRAIVRTEPRAHVRNFEANLLTYIEFYEEDFPWRYTPANPATSGINARRLRPWLALVVVKDEEATLTPDPTGLPYITIEPEAIDAVLPNEQETWAWAHVHVNEALVNQGGSGLETELEQELEQDPDVALSRLLCPRKLNPSIAYTAFLIPAFETGRVAGLGGDPSGIKAQTPAWTRGNMPHSTFRPFDFPVYYHWEFSTGALGDFESLVSVLKPMVMEPETGKLPMDIQEPGMGLDGKADSLTLGFEGALRPPAFVPDVFPNGTGDTDFVDGLREITNLGADMTTDDGTGNSSAANVSNPFIPTTIGEDPIVAPPIYGYWHALISRLGANGNPAWIESLNLDPRHRGAAGLGTRSVQANQEELMQQAWTQVGSINEANQRIREADMARLVSDCLYKKHLAHAPEEKFIAITGTMHQRVLNNAAEAKTVDQQFQESRIPNAVKSAAFKRIARPGKKSNRKLVRHDSNLKNLQTQLMNKLDRDETESGSIRSARLKRAPANALGMNAFQNVLQSALSNYQSDNDLQSREGLFAVLEEANLSSLNKTTLKSRVDSKPWNSTIKTRVKSYIDNITAYSKQTGNVIQASLRSSTFESAFGKASTAKTYNRVTVRDGSQSNGAIAPAVAFNDLQEFQSAYVTLQNNSSGLPSPSESPRIGGLGNIKQILGQKLNPQITISKRVREQIQVWSDGAPQPIQELRPIMAHPEFEEPVYQYLVKLSQDFVLPNVGSIPANSITILETNQAFIESYMAGLNHEMARELLWREFPTDRRGSYFRRFWDVKDNLAGDPHTDHFDIEKMHLWDGALGDHAVRGGDQEALLVLVVRGQLLEKFPNTVIYAQKALYDSSDPTKPRRLPNDINGGQIKYPVFTAELEPDITLLGFNLTFAEARGDRVEDPATDTSGLNPGWFFVFKERPGQVKFGLDDFIGPLGETDVLPSGAPETWDDLSWEHLVDDKDELLSFQLNFSRALQVTNPPASEPNPGWGDNAADLAAILYQDPVIFARHAGEMLPD